MATADGEQKDDSCPGVDVQVKLKGQSACDVYFPAPITPKE